MPSRTRFRIEALAACAAALLAAVTLVWRDWIELVFRVDPDHGNGSVEWAAVGVLALVALALAVAARRELLRLRAA